MATARLLCIGFVLYALFVFVGIRQLHSATATQCRTHDWPASQHYTHMEWCLDNGYPTR
jgi:hypothetical protein